MKQLFKRSLLTAASLALLTFGAAVPAKAQWFDQEEVEQSRFVAVAVPRAFGPQLLILEQKDISGPECWSESGDRPTIIDPLLLNFDFTYVCGRATDSNGYSIRMADTDLAMTYGLTLQAHSGEIVLLGIPRFDPNAEPLLIGRTHGMASGFTKIVLEPGWRFTKRSYQGQELGHIYLTNDWAPTDAQTYNPQQEN